MMSLPRHMDNASSVLQCLPGNRDESMSEERDENLSPAPFEDVSEEKKRKPRSIIIRGELVDLTDDLLTASVLGQMLYWCQRVKDFDLYITEESADPPKCFSALQHGWFYKVNQELIEETILRVTFVTFRRYMSFLRTRGWIQTRRNPENKLDPKIQYRVSLRKLCNDLQRKGHTLSSFEAYEIFPHVPKDSGTKSKPEKTNAAAEGNTPSKERYL